MISFHLRYRPITVFRPPLPAVTVFGSTLHTVTDRYITVTLPLLAVPDRY